VGGSGFSQTGVELHTSIDPTTRGHDDTRTGARGDEIVLSQSLKHIDFAGKGMIFLGAESPCLNPLPKIEFR